MSQVLISRAEILVQQNRYEEASKVLSDLLPSDPNNVMVLAMLSEVNLQLDKVVESKDQINRAISLEPDSAYLYFIKSRVTLAQDNYNEAEELLEHAISLNPHDADFFALWASVKMERKQYKEALVLSNKSLERDAENIHGLNVRSMALLKLDKKEESFLTIEGALNKDPNNPHTHSNYGWGHLEKGNHKKALYHFKEALKNDPSLVNAQVGMTEALKAKYFLYRLFLKYSFWIGNMTSRYQWAVIIGFYLLFRVLRTVANTSPMLEPFLTPLLVFLTILAISTWLTTPISNLFLRINSFGRHLLSKKERLSSNFVGICVLILIAGVIGLLVTDEISWLALAAFGFGMMIPCSAMFSPTKYKNALVIYAGMMTIVGLLAVTETYFTGNLLTTYANVFIFGFVGFQWIANFLIIREENI